MRTSVYVSVGMLLVVPYSLLCACAEHVLLLNRAPALLHRACAAEVAGYIAAGSLPAILAERAGRHRGPVHVPLRPEPVH